MYNKEEFKNELQEMLVEMFPDRDSNLISVTVNGKAQEGFRLDKTGEDTSPIFLLNSCYDLYEKHNDINEVRTCIKTIVQEHKKASETFEYFQTHFFDALSINLFDTTMQPDAIKGITKPFGDLLQSLVLVRQANECFFERLILNEENLHNFKEYLGNTTLEDLWYLAKKNIEEYSYEFSSVSELLGISGLLQEKEDLYFKGEIENCDSSHSDECFIRFSVSDLQTAEMQKKLKDYIKKGGNGFIELYMIRVVEINNSTPILLNKKLLTGIGTALNSSFYILPSSNKELIVFTGDGGCDEQILKQMIWDTNRSAVSENDLFTDELFYYDLQYEEVEFLGRYTTVTVN